jgi:hypothetical protein
VFLEQVAVLERVVLLEQMGQTVLMVHQEHPVFLEQVAVLEQAE